MYVFALHVRLHDADKMSLSNIAFLVPLPIALILKSDDLKSKVYFLPT